MKPRVLLIALLAFIPLACVSDRTLSDSFLAPTKDVRSDPGRFGIPFENVVVACDDGTRLSAWYMPPKRAGAMTVMFCHGSSANIAYYHPYYRYLHEAGFGVYLFDYRGYGDSEGESSVDALCSDTEAAYRTLMSRPEVGNGGVALFGLSLGTITALHCAAHHPEVKGVIVEDVVSPERALDKEMGGFLSFVVRMGSVRSGLEPIDNLAQMDCPVFFVVGAFDALLTTQVEAYESYSGPKASWIMAETGHAPEGLLIHDQRYQSLTAEFLQRCAQGKEPRLQNQWHPQAGSGGYVVDVDLYPADPDEPGMKALETVIVDVKGHAHFDRRWVDSTVSSVTIEQDHEIISVSSMFLDDVVRIEDVWTYRETTLSRGARVLPMLRSLSTLVRESINPTVEAKSMHETVLAFEQEASFHPLLEAELAPSFLELGRAFIGSTDADEKALGLTYLRRCVAARPIDPELHYWPGIPYRAHFIHEEAVNQAKTLLSSQNAR